MSVFLIIIFPFVVFNSTTTAAVSSIFLTQDVYLFSHHVVLELQQLQYDFLIDPRELRASSSILFSSGIASLTLPLTEEALIRFASVSW